MADTTASWWSSLSKGKAFSIHMALSLLVFSSLVLVMFFFWFPGELFFLDGGWQGLKLVAMVDLILGPLLTLVLYKPRKPKLLLDMSMIAAFQIAALAYGFVATYQQRTVAVVFADRGFITLSNQAHQEANAKLSALKLTPRSINDIDASTPAMLLTPAPKNFGKYLEELFNGYPESHERSDQFLAIASANDAMRDSALSNEKLKEDGSYEAVQKALKNIKYDPKDMELYSFKSRYSSGVAVFDPASKRIIDYVPIDKPIVKTAEVADS